MYTESEIEKLIKNSPFKKEIVIISEIINDLDSEYKTLKKRNDNNLTEEFLEKSRILIKSRDAVIKAVTMKIVAVDKTISYEVLRDKEKLRLEDG